MALTTSKAQLLDDLRREEEQFEALLDEIGEAHMTQPRAEGEWSIKDIVAHLTSWRRRTVGRFQAALRHEPQPTPPWPSDLHTDDEVNAWFYTTDRDKPVSVVLSESREVFGRLVETLAAFPEAELHDSANFPWLQGEPWNGAELFGHFHDEHEADMRAWLEKVRSGEQ